MKQWKRAAWAAVAGAASLVAGIAGPAAAAAGAVAGASATPRAASVWVKDCSTSKFAMRPSMFLVACADGNTFFKGLRWTGWGTRHAVGRGELWANTCTPDCAQGTFVSEPGTLTLSRIGRHDGRRAYGHAYMKPLAPNKRHFTAFGYNLSYTH